MPIIFSDLRRSVAMCVTFHIPTVTTPKTIHTPLSSALAVLHDPISLTRLNPLVITVEQCTKDPRVYVITDRLRVFGFTVGIQMTYTAKFTLMEDGVDTEIEAPGGIHLINRWRVKANGEGVVVTGNGGVFNRPATAMSDLTFTVTVHSNALVRPLVVYTLKKSHREFMDSLAKKLEGCPLNAEHQPQSKATTMAIWIVFLVIALQPVIAMQFDWPFHVTSDNLFWQAGVASVLAGALIIVVFMSNTDPYGAYHIGLNVRPDADSSVPPNTEWLNMGYWKVNPISAPYGAR